MRHPSFRLGRRHLMALFKNAAFQADPWQALDGAASLPQDGHVILSLAQWNACRESQLGTNVPLGLHLDPDAPLEAIAPDLPRFALVAVAFPKYTDGRGYSIGRKIRSYYGFSGELRAVGDVLFDQIQLMERCGFDAFEIADPATRRLLEAGRRPAMTRFYQPALGPEIPAGTRPWERQLKR